MCVITRRSGTRTKRKNNNNNKSCVRGRAQRDRRLDRMAHGTRMNGARDGRRLGPPTWSPMSHRVIFGKYVIFLRSHWPAGPQCRHIVDAESSEHLFAGRRGDWNGSVVEWRTYAANTGRGRVPDFPSRTDFFFILRTSVKSSVSNEKASTSR